VILKAISESDKNPNMSNKFIAYRRLIAVKNT